MNIDNVFRDFRNWLESSIPRSVGSYASYVRSLHNAVNHEFGPGWFERMLVGDKVETSRRMRFCCSAFIEEMIRCSKGGNRKNWQNRRSGFNKFEEFLDFGADSAERLRGETDDARNRDQEPRVQCVRTPVEPVINPLSYVRADAPARSLDHRKLVSKFKSRLTTQRRMYPNIAADGVLCDLLFTPKLIGKVFGRGMYNAWNRWLNDGIEKIRVLCSDVGDYVSFSEVKQIDIYGDCRFVVTKNDGTNFELRTKTRTGGIEKEQDVLRKRNETAPNWSDITIDHVIPLENVIREHINDLHGLKVLSKKFAKFNTDRGGVFNGRKDDWVNDLYEHYREELNTDAMRNLLSVDLGIIYGYGRGYELMDLRENSGKGKNG